MLGKYPLAECLVLFLLFQLFKSSFILTCTRGQTSCLGARSRTFPSSVVDNFEQESVAARLEASDILGVMNDFLNHFLAVSGHTFVFCENSVNLTYDHWRKLTSSFPALRYWASGRTSSDRLKKHFICPLAGNWSGIFRSV